MRATVKDDAILVAILFLMAATFSCWFVTSGIVKRAYFYQETFAPAVMFACGKGFVQPKYVPNQLDDFLLLRSSSFNCAELPAKPDVVPLNLFQNAHKYLMCSVGYTWKLTGITWDSLKYFYAVVYSITIILAYAIFRQMGNRLLSFAFAGLLLISSVQLFNLPHLRDYIKAPFLLAIVLIIAVVIKSDISRAALAGYSLLSGMIIGTGIGFRADILIIAPLYIVSILLFTRCKLTELLAAKFISICIFVIAIAVFSWPIFSNMKSGSNYPHVIMLGLMSEFDSKLGLTPSYVDLGYHYLDRYADTILNARAVLNGYKGDAIVYPSVQYDKIGMEYIKQIYATMPADILTRYVAAVWEILHLPFKAYSSFEDMCFFYDDIVIKQVLQISKLRVWNYVLIISLIISSAALLYRSKKQFFAVFIILFYLSGYPFLQFSIRHYFYLQVIGLSVLLMSIVTAAWALKHRKEINDILIGSKYKITMVIVGTLLVPLFGIKAIRHYQTANIHDIVKNYLESPKQAQPIIMTNTGNGISKVEIPARYNDSYAANKVLVDYYIAYFNNNKCSMNVINMSLKYLFKDQTYNFNHNYTIHIDSNTKYIFPVFARGAELRFEGIEFPNEHYKCLVGMDKITDTSKTKMPLFITLGDKWLQQPSYSTMRILR